MMLKLGLFRLVFTEFRHLVLQIILIVLNNYSKQSEMNPSFTKGGGGGGGGGRADPSKGFSSITFEKNKLKTPIFA